MILAARFQVEKRASAVSARTALFSRPCASYPLRSHTRVSWHSYAAMASFGKLLPAIICSLWASSEVDSEPKGGSAKGLADSR